MQAFRKMLAFAGCSAFALTAAPVFAHHSFAMFDNTKTVTLEGTIKEFQFTNPHCWVQILVLDPTTGTSVEWSIEGGGPNQMVRQGWTAASLKPGDKVVLLMHPLKDGSTGGSLMTVSINGQKVGGMK
jgi:hypothetical protein